MKLVVFSKCRLRLPLVRSCMCSDTINLPHFQGSSAVMTAAFMLVRHLFAIVILPVTMTLLIPRWLVAGSGIGEMWAPESAVAAIARIAGGFSFLAGLGLFLWCLYLFAARGKG